MIVTFCSNRCKHFIFGTNLDETVPGVVGEKVGEMKSWNFPRDAANIQQNFNRHLNMFRE